MKAFSQEGLSQVHLVSPSSPTSSVAIKTCMNTGFSTTGYSNTTSRMSGSYVLSEFKPTLKISVPPELTWFHLVFHSFKDFSPSTLSPLSYLGRKKTMLVKMLPWTVSTISKWVEHSCHLGTGGQWKM